MCNNCEVLAERVRELEKGAKEAVPIMFGNLQTAIARAEKTEAERDEALRKLDIYERTAPIVAAQIENLTRQRDDAWTNLRSIGYGQPPIRKGLNE